MKALGILAGPRKGHTTDMIIDSVLKGLKDRGDETEKISLYDYTIQPCKGCGTCYDTGKCVIDDDQGIILEKMDKTDIIVFGSPVYWSNVSSVGKVFIDRSLPFFKMGKIGPKRTDPRPGKVVLIASCGVPFPLSHMMGIVPGCLKAMKRPFSNMKTRIKTFYCAGMVDAQKSFPSAKVLNKAYYLGKTL